MYVGEGHLRVHCGCHLNIIWGCCEICRLHIIWGCHEICYLRLIWGCRAVSFTHFSYFCKFYVDNNDLT